MGFDLCLPKSNLTQGKDNFSDNLDLFDFKNSNNYWILITYSHLIKGILKVIVKHKIITVTA